MNKLTAKQERFVEEYLCDLNATAAAGRAGYSDPNIGRQLITKNNVAVAIAAGQAERSARTEVTQDYVLAVIMDTIERCKQPADHNPAAVLKGAELLGRHLAMFTDKKTVTHIDGDRLDAMVEHITDNGKYIGQSRRDH